MKNIVRITIKILIILVILQTIYISTVQASFWGDIFQAGDEFLNTGSRQNSQLSSSELKSKISDIYNLLFILGIVLSVVIGAILGIKYMFGSLEEQAKIKETLIPYVVGCIVVFGAFGIWKIAIIVFSNIN